MVRSIIGGETYAFSDGFDFASLMSHDLQRILKRKIPLTMITDSEQLFKIIIKSMTTPEKRLMIDVEAARAAYNEGEIRDVGWIPGAKNSADEFTKAPECPVLIKILDTGVCDVDAEHWVVRIPNGNEGK